MPNQRRRSGDIRAVSRRHPRLQRARRSGGPPRYCRTFGVHDLAVLRFDDCQDHRARPRPAGSDCPHAAHARDDGHRRNQDDGADAAEDHQRPGLHRGKAEHVVHGALRAIDKSNQFSGGKRVITNRLHAIVDVDLAVRAGWTPIDLARAVLDGGATLIQLRAKQLSSAAFLDLADAAVRLAHSYHASVIVNDRADIALMSAAAGVHVGQDDLPPSAARRLLGEEALIGFFTHSVVQVERALREPISYVAVGPVFGTRSKDTGYAAVGLELVGNAVRLAGELPVVAIGGITLDNARSVIEAGAAAV